MTDEPLTPLHQSAVVVREELDRWLTEYDRVDVTAEVVVCDQGVHLDLVGLHARMTAHMRPRPDRDGPIAASSARFFIAHCMTALDVMQRRAALPAPMDRDAVSAKIAAELGAIVAAQREDGTQ